MEQHISISEADRRRGLAFVSIAAACIGFVLSAQLALNNNFLVGEIHISGFQAGLLEAVRESEGILALGVLALIAGLTEPLIASLVLVLVCLGLGAYSFAPSYHAVMLMSVVWSLGFHVWSPLPNSMTLALAKPGTAGTQLGKVASAGALGSGIGLAIAFALTLVGVPIRPLYILIGAAAAVGAAACFGIPRKIKTPGPSFVFRRRYGMYYALNFLEGWRKQIAMAFGGFLLVNVYHAPLLVMIGLWGANQAIGYFFSPVVGRMLDRIGERKVLTFYYFFVTCVFVVYASTTSPPSPCPSSAESSGPPWAISGLSSSGYPPLRRASSSCAGCRASRAPRGGLPSGTPKPPPPRGYAGSLRGRG
ncbi:MAG: hypothetical protein NT005_04110 [Spirochaetes bacterium]|nr:hypothetical protein [Spirochaetota bacterium]